MKDCGACPCCGHTLSAWDWIRSPSPFQAKCRGCKTKLIAVARDNGVASLAFGAMFICCGMTIVIPAVLFLAWGLHATAVATLLVLLSALEFCTVLVVKKWTDIVPLNSHPSRRWFRIHLSTAIILMLAASALLWTNTRVYLIQEIGDASQSVYSLGRGWPFVYVEMVTTHPDWPRGDWGMYAQRQQKHDGTLFWRYTLIDGRIALVDVLVAIQILLTVAILFEWWWRLRAPRPAQPALNDEASEEELTRHSVSSANPEWLDEEE